MVSADTSSNLLGALSLSQLGATPQRWYVDWSHFEPGLLPHPHIYVVNPYESSAEGPMNVWCLSCLAQFNIHIVPQGRCTGQTHHIHTEVGEGNVVAECCHCGLHINAIKEQPTIPRSLISRIEKARNPKSTNIEAPHFQDTLALLIRVLTDAVKSPEESAASSPGSINVESRVFRTQIGLDEASQAFFDFARFTLVDKRYYPPENTPQNIQFLNRCRFQLELALMDAKQHTPGMFQVVKNLFGGYKVEYAYEQIFRKLGVADYSRDPRAKALDLSIPTTLNAEKISEAKLLGCLSDMCDDSIIDAFRTQVSHDPSNAHLRVDALSRIQKARQSDKLNVEIICKRSEGIVTHEELRRAYRDFEIPNEGVNISNEIILGLIRASLHTSSKENLKIIANARNDPELNRLVEEVSTEFAPVDEDLLEYYAQNPVGLSNIGNTCYLNSLLQYIYTVKDIRETVLNMELYVENEDAEDWKGKVVDGRSLSRSYVGAAKELARELRNLFTMMESAKARSVTPSKRLVELLLPEEEESAPNGNGHSMHNNGQRDYQFFRQQDVSETLAIMMAKLNAAFKPISMPDGKPEDRFDSLFHAKAHRKSLETNKETGKKEIERIPEDFSTLLLNVVEEDITMEELIDEYFEPHDKDLDHMKKENSESTEGIEGHGNPEANKDQPIIPPPRHIAVTELPPVLHIQLMRTHFNRSHQTSYKSNARVSIPKRLYMDQYLESNEENADRIKRIRLWKEERTRCRQTLNKIKLDREIAMELKKFEENPAPSTGQNPNDTSAPQPEAQPETQPESQPGTHPDAQPEKQPETQEGAPQDVQPNGHVLESETIKLPTPENPVANGYAESDYAAEEEQLTKISDLTAKIQEESLDLGESQYNLHAVFHHEGSAEFGHYWIYILDDQADDTRWLKYSDDRIEVAQESEVLSGTQGSNACFCVYTRSKSDKVQTVWRCIVE